MKNKKLLWLLPTVLILTLTVLTMGILTACQWGNQPDNEPSESQTQPEPTLPEPTEPEPTELIVPPDTQPDATEPEETETSGGTGGANVNTGTGGGYDPGETDPEATEPEEEVTEPPIEVPPAGSENNPYYENIQNGAGEFTTVKIPAGATVHYRIQTAGLFLQVDDTDITVNYGDAAAIDTETDITELPGDDTAPISLSFTNNGTEDKNFVITVMGPVGSQSNPIDVESLERIEVSLDAEDLDGVFYRWTADKAGMLKLWAEGDSQVEFNVLIDEEPAQLTRDNGGRLCVPVQAEDEILVQILAKADEAGNLPAAQTVLKGYVAQMVKHSVMLLPFEAEPVTVAAGESVYFTVSGVSDRYIEIAAENACLYYGEETVLPNENGVLNLNCEEDTVQIEICNTGDSEDTYVLQVNCPLGDILNPQILTQLGDTVEIKTTADNGGYYCLYTAPAPGVVTFQVWTAPANYAAVTNILLTNNTSGESASLSDSQEEAASVRVAEGDEISIVVTVEDSLGNSLDAQLSIIGNLLGTEKNPIVVAFPGFTAEIAASQTLYYQCFNMNGVNFNLSGTNAIVTHIGQEYSGENITFAVVCNGRDPDVFAITNPGTSDATYEVTFANPLGQRENPAPLVLGTNILTQEAGADDYYYTFKATKAGTLTLTFDENAQWVYTVNNLTRSIYGDIQWSDSVPQMACHSITVKKNDVIQIVVNTYDKNNKFSNPAGTVEFTAEYVTGPISIKNLNIPTSVTLIPGEYAAYTGQFYGKVLTINSTSNTVVYFNGIEYKPSGGKITVRFPEAGSDTADLEFRIHNTGTENITRSMKFSAQ